ncbi:MAG: ATP cone domain-containing protein, partial [Eubacteriales bacterium]
MNIIKRSGAEEIFNITKIIQAMTKANNEVPEVERMTADEIRAAADRVADACRHMERAANVEEIQDLVENEIMAMDKYNVARKYITYRYTRALVRKSNTTDEQILSLIECNNEEVKQENSNKNPTVNSVQRDYMAGEVS